MKNIGIICWMIFGAFALAACSKEELAGGGPLHSQNTVNVTITAAPLHFGADSKTAVTPGENGSYIPSWLESDKLFVWADNIPVSNEGAQPSAMANSQPGETATFTGQLSLSAGGHILYGYASSGYQNVEYSADGVIFDIPAIQHPGPASFDPAADLLIVRPQQVSLGDGQAELSVNDALFTRALAAIRLILVDDTADGSLADDAVISASLVPSDMENNPLTGKAVINVKEGGDISYFTTKDGVTAEYEASAMHINGSDAIWLLVNPLTFTSDAELTVITGNKEIHKSIALNGASLRRGDVGNLPVTLTDADVIDMSEVTVNGVNVSRNADGGYEAVVEMTQNGTMTVSGYAPGFADWTVDPDYITGENGSYTFLPVGGKYKVIMEIDDKFFRFQRMNADGSGLAVLNEDKTGAIWLIGSDCIGKPTLEQTPNWNPGQYALCLSQIEPGKFQITLEAGRQLKTEGINFKFYHQNGWGGEFKSANLSTASSLLRIDSSEGSDGNIYWADGSYREDGAIYTFVVDMTNATFTDGAWSGAVLSVEVNGEPEILPDITVNASASGENYTWTGEIEQGNSIGVMGVPDFTSWYLDPDYFSENEDGLPVFNAMSGNYRMDFYSGGKYVRITRLNESGTYASLADGGLWLMGWGIATPFLNNSQPGWDNTDNAYCMAEVRKNVFQFTGRAADESSTVPGDRIRMDYLDFKYYYSNPWGNGEANRGQQTLSGNAYEFITLTDSGNITMDRQDVGLVKLESGKTYRLTIDLSGGSYDGQTFTGSEKITFEKLD